MAVNSLSHFTGLRDRATPIGNDSDSQVFHRAWWHFAQMWPTHPGNRAYNEAKIEIGSFLASVRWGLTA